MTQDSSNVAVTTAVREIYYKGQILADFNPAAPVTQILQMHAAEHPELATAQIEGPTLVDGKSRYTIAARIGTKG